MNDEVQDGHKFSEETQKKVEKTLRGDENNRAIIDIVDDVKQRTCNQIAELVARQMDIAVTKALLNSGQKFTVNFKTVLDPGDTMIGIESTISFSTKFTDSTEQETVSTLPELPGMENA